MPKQYPLPFGDGDLDLSLEEPDPQEVQSNPQEQAQVANDASPSHDATSSTEQAALLISPFRDFEITLLALSRVRGLGIKTIRTLYEYFPDLSAIWSLPSETLAATFQKLKIRDSVALATTIQVEQDRLRAEAQRELYWLRGENIQLIARHDPGFPSNLATLLDGPYWLFVEGEIAALQTPLVGIVGTRTPSSIGIQTAERLAAFVCREGFGIVSGLAEGIDAAAHRVGLYYRAPQVAVLGTGIDIIFPASTEGIRRRILETGGAVVTEYMPGDNYSRSNFVQRNRIQAGLSLALSPVESQAQSGTAHTMRFAATYGRPLFGVVRGQPAPRNDIVAMLAAQNAPVFDLDQRDDLAALLGWLHTVIVPSIWPAIRRKVDGRSFFRDILRLVDDVLDDVPVSPADLSWLQAQLAARLNGIVDLQLAPTQQRGVDER